MNSLLVKYPSFLRLFYPQRLSRLKAQKTIFITFDDGPVPEVTPWVLEQLRKYQAKATFFCIGDNVRKNPEVFKQILEERHSIGNHTYNHLDGWKTSTKDYIQNTQQAGGIIGSTFEKWKVESGKSENIQQNQAQNSGIKLFRPPFGKIRNSQAKAIVRMGYKIVMWDVISWDFNTEESPENCYQNIIKNAQEGSILVFHDSIKASKNLKAALPKILKYYSEKGFSFKSL